MCIDAINHMPGRARVLEDWRRVLKPGGWLLFTDPIVLTGPVTNREIAVRASIGVFIFVPAGLDQALLEQAGFKVERVEDRTRNMSENAAGWRDARSRREADLRAIEGDEAFEASSGFSTPPPASPPKGGSPASRFLRKGHRSGKRVGECAGRSGPFALRQRSSGSATPAQAGASSAGRPVAGAAWSRIGVRCSRIAARICRNWYGGLATCLMHRA